MQVSISKSILDNVLTALQPFVDKKDQAQITSHVFIEARDGHLICRATDFEMGLTANIDVVEIKEEGIATIKGKQALDIIKRLKDEDVLLSTIDENLHIKQGRSAFKIPMFIAEEYPSFPSIEGLGRLEINSNELISSFKKVMPVIATSSLKRELNGALLDIRESYYSFAASDSRRLAVLKYNKQSQSSLALIFPKKAIAEIQKLFYDDIELFFNEKNVIIQGKNYTFYSHLINGKFPDYEKIIPREGDIKTKLNLPKAAIIEGLKIIESVTNDIKLTFRPHEIIFESLKNDTAGSEAKTEIELELPISEEVSIGVKSNHIMDFLTHCDTANFDWELKATNEQFILRSENFMSVIMPIILPQ